MSEPAPKDQPEPIDWNAPAPKTPAGKQVPRAMQPEVRLLYRVLRNTETGDVRVETFEPEDAMGGKPNPGTPKDKRLSANKPKPTGRKGGKGK